MARRRGWCQECGWGTVHGPMAFFKRRCTTAVRHIFERLATMLATAWRITSAFTCSVQISSHPRLLSLCPVSHSWYWSLHDEARRAYSERCKRGEKLRFLANPGLREAIRKQKILRYRENEHYQRRCLVSEWCFTYPWLREQLSWKTHRPIYYNQKAKHYCNGCERATTSGLGRCKIEAFLPLIHAFLRRLTDSRFSVQGSQTILSKPRKWSEHHSSRIHNLIPCFCIVSRFLSSVQLLPTPRYPFPVVVTLFFDGTVHTCSYSLMVSAS